MRFDQLGLLMSGYYHQDYDIVGFWETTDLYVSDSEPQQVEQLKRELTHVLGTMDDDQIRGLLKSLDCELNESVDPNGYRGWLEGIRDRLGEAS